MTLETVKQYKCTAAGPRESVASFTLDCLTFSTAAEWARLYIQDEFGPVWRVTELREVPENDL